jgi:hypothetical protein
MRRARTSDVLSALAAAHPGPRVSLGEVVAALGERGFGILILMLALPNAAPGPAMPGLSAALAVPLCLLAAQLAGGREEPLLPGWLLRRSMPLARFRRLVGYAAPSIARAERWLKPRPGVPEKRWRGLALLALAPVLAVPLPFANLPPAAALTVIALGLIEKDGAAVRLGLLLAIPASLWVAALVFGGYRLVAAFLF